MNRPLVEMLALGLASVSSLVVLIWAEEGLRLILAGGPGLSAWNVSITTLSLMFLALQWALWRQRRAVH